MNKRLYLGVATASCAALFWLCAAGLRAQSSAPPQHPSARTPVVVELFTSEGCSSCPPADTLLARIDSVQPFASIDVIPIEEHVDYWDDQGWKDPFSSVRWTDRQRDYTFSQHTGSPYTPEMVVDGTVGFLGSRGPMVRDAILRAAANQTTKVDLQEVSPIQNGMVTFKVAIEKLTNDPKKEKSDVILGITETGLHSNVGAGENSGHELHHSAVLRELKVIGEIGKNGQDSFSAEPSVKLGAKWDTTNLRAVAFVQEKKSRRILGAAEIHLTQ